MAIGALGLAEGVSPIWAGPLRRVAGLERCPPGTQLGGWTL